VAFRDDREALLQRVGVLDTLRAMTIPSPGHVLDVEASFVFAASP
jgi:hypothetical protein